MHKLLVILLAVIGAALGVVLTLAAGSMCSDGVSDSFCGLNFLVWNFSSGGALAASGALGALTGTSVGLLVSYGLGRRRRANKPAGA